MECLTCRTGQAHLTTDLYICDGCGLISSNLKPDVSLYGADYHLKHQIYRKTEIGRSLLAIRRSLLYKYVQNGLVLDFGCGSGAFHRSLNSGLTGVGYDINPYEGFDDSDCLVNFPFIAMTAWDVLEHMENPEVVIRKVDPKYIFVSTPSTDDWRKDIRKITGWRHYRPNEHIHLFNANSLFAFLETVGYDVMEMNYDESRIRKSGGKMNILTMVGERRPRSGEHS